MVPGADVAADAAAATVAVVVTMTVAGVAMQEQKSSATDDGPAVSCE